MKGDLLSFAMFAEPCDRVLTVDTLRVEVVIIFVPYSPRSELSK